MTNLTVTTFRGFATKTPRNPLKLIHAKTDLTKTIFTKINLLKVSYALLNIPFPWFSLGYIRINYFCNSTPA